MLNTTHPSINAQNFWKEAQDLIINLYSRWLDEKEYEDIKDYAQPLQLLAQKHNVVIDKMTARPFGCKFSTDGRQFQLSITSNGSYSYKRIK